MSQTLEPLSYDEQKQETSQNGQVQMLIKLLFPNGLPETCEADGINTEFVEYVHKLGTRYSVTDINNELMMVQDEKVDIEERLKEIACANYRTFVETYRCSAIIVDGLDNAEETLRQLLMKGLPAVMAQCEQLSSAENAAAVINGIKADRKLNTMMLLRCDQLSQFIQLPNLMRQCVQCDLYDSSFELIAYCRQIANKCGHIHLVKSITNEVETQWLQLRRHLIDQLRTTDIQLPKCLQLMGYLRRMAVFNESQLKFIFLQARNCWLASLLNNLKNNQEDGVGDSSRSSQYLSKIIELYRVNVFNIITQYRAAFTDDDPAAAAFYHDHYQTNVPIFHAWSTKKLNDFLLVVDELLCDCSVGSFDSLYGQCLYFGMSFGRIGCDFRGLIGRVFTKAILNHFECAISQADTQLKSHMQTFMLSMAQFDSTGSDHQQQETDAECPPIGLLEFEGFAAYCNCMISALNDVRLCRPSLSVLIQMTRKLEQSMKCTSKLLSEFYEREKNTLSAGQRQSLQRLCYYYGCLYVPQIERLLHRIFIPSDVASYYGISLSDLQTKGVGYIDVASIVSPISHILPPPPATSLSEVQLTDEDSLSCMTSELTQCEHDQQPQSDDEQSMIIHSGTTMTMTDVVSELKMAD